MSELRNWIGKSERKVDEISMVLVRRLAATLGVECPANGQTLPPLWHWMFFQAEVVPTNLGKDGHPALGGFMPPANGRNRMWAGGSFVFDKPLLIGQAAACVSTITDVQEKNGKTGSLIFVTVQHEYFQNEHLLFKEFQNIVYREPTPPKRLSDKAVDAQWSNQINPSAVQLFRYSAVTFNGHRIHYDYPYVTQEEGYENVVVHGPLMATWSLNGFINANPDKKLISFEYQGVRPTQVPTSIYAEGKLIDASHADVWIGNDNGVIQKGKVVFK